MILQHHHCVVLACGAASGVFVVSLLVFVNILPCGLETRGGGRVSIPPPPSTPVSLVWDLWTTPPPKTR